MIYFEWRDTENQQYISARVLVNKKWGNRCSTKETNTFLRGKLGALRVTLRVEASFIYLFLDFEKKSQHQEFPKHRHGSAVGVTAALVNARKVEK